MKWTRNTTHQTKWMGKSDQSVNFKQNLKQFKIENNLQTARNRFKGKILNCELTIEHV